MLTITSYEIHKNAMAETPGKFHICAVMGDLVESEEIARRRGTFATRAAGARALAELREGRA